MRLIRLLIILVLIILGVTFSVLNAEQVQLHYYAGTLSLPLSLVIASSFFIGILLGLIVMMGKVIGLRFENRRLQKMLRQWQGKADE